MKKRNYSQFCALAKGLDVVGERWTLLIVRDLLLGPRRYSDFMNSLTGITTNLLSKRLKEMEALDLVEKYKLPSGHEGYRLSTSGRELEAVIFAVGDWGERFLGQPDADDKLSLRWSMVAVRRRSTQIDKQWFIQIESEHEVYQVRTGLARYEVHHGDAWQSDVHVTGKEMALLALLSKRVPERELIDDGRIKIKGNPQAFDDFMAGIHVKKQPT